jgi:hypothetical protein
MKPKDVELRRRRLLPEKNLGKNYVITEFNPQLIKNMKISLTSQIDQFQSPQSIKSAIWKLLKVIVRQLQCFKPSHALEPTSIKITQATIN